MLLPPLARACRPGFRAFPPRPLHSAIATRVFTSSPLHRKDVHGNRPASVQTGQAKKQSTPVAKPPSSRDALLAEQTVSNKEQRKADWAIIREMSHYLWPKNNLGDRFRVALAVGLLVGAKVLNVQVPFYFKSIVDSMNIDFIAVGGTAWTVAGSMIVACKPPSPL
jgi:ATP-binding cassette subfamily B (MDR/TAP) protein 7